MDNEITLKLLEELIQIKKYLAVIAQDKIAEFNDKISKMYLTTEARKKMYDLFDGVHTYKDISEIAGVSAEAVRQFAVSLEKAGIIGYVLDGKNRQPKRIF